MLLNKCIRAYFVEQGLYQCYTPERKRLHDLGGRFAAEVNIRRALTYDVLGSNPYPLADAKEMTYLSLFTSDRRNMTFILFSRLRDDKGQYPDKYPPRYMSTTALSGDVTAMVPVALSRRLNSIFEKALLADGHLHRNFEVRSRQNAPQ